MTEMLNQNTDKKSFLEKRIHEQAVDQFYAACSKALEGLGQSILGELKFENEPKSFNCEELRYAFHEMCSSKSYPYDFVDDYLKANFKGYESFKAEKIKEYEKEKTDQILDEIGGLTELLRNNGDIPF